MKTTKQAFEAITESSLCRRDGKEIDICQAIIDLCEAINNEEETDWSIGEGGEYTLDNFLVGSYWALCDCHGGQSSDSYAALCAIGGIFSSGMSSLDKDNTSEYWAYWAYCDVCKALGCEV